MVKKEQIEEIVSKALKCRKEIPVGMAVGIFLEVMEHLVKDKKGPLQYVAKELGSRTLESIFTSVVSSYVSSLYISANFNSFEEAMQFAKEQGINEVTIEGEKENEKESKYDA